MNDRPRSTLTPDTTSLLAQRYREVRTASENLAAPPSPEDCAIQSMPASSSPFPASARRQFSGFRLARDL